MLRPLQVFWQKVSPHRGTRDRSPQSPGLGPLVTNLSGDDAPQLSFPNTKQMRSFLRCLRFAFGFVLLRVGLNLKVTVPRLG